MKRVLSIICYLVGAHMWRYGRGTKLKHCRRCGKISVISSRKTTGE